METTQSGVSAPATFADPADAFQSMYDRGGFDPAGKIPEDASTHQQTRQDETVTQQQTQDTGLQQQEQQAGEQESQTGKPEGEEEAAEYKSLEDFLTANKFDPESVKGLSVTTKVDGVEKQVPLSEIIKSYQLESHVNNKSIQLSEQQKAFEQEQQAARQLVAQQLQNTKTLGNLAMQQLNADFQRVNWDQLRASDPAQYAALYTDFQQRQGAIQSHLNAVQQQEAMQAQQQQQKLAQRAQQEMAKVIQMHPEWNDPTVYSKAQSDMRAVAKQLGYSDAELDQVYDHRLVSLLHMAASQSQLQAAKPEALKKVREAPRMAKPGARQEADPKSAVRQQAIERYNRNPRDPDAQAALFELLA